MAPANRTTTYLGGELLILVFGIPAPEGWGEEEEEESGGLPVHPEGG